MDEMRTTMIMAIVVIKASKKLESSSPDNNTCPVYSVIVAGLHFIYFSKIDVTVEMANTTKIETKATLPFPFINVLKKSVIVTTKTNHIL